MEFFSKVEHDIYVLQSRGPGMCMSSPNHILISFRGHGGVTYDLARQTSAELQILRIPMPDRVPRWMHDVCEYFVLFFIEKLTVVAATLPVALVGGKQWNTSSAKSH